MVFYSDGFKYSIKELGGKMFFPILNLWYLNIITIFDNIQKYLKPDVIFSITYKNLSIYLSIDPLNLIRRLYLS